MTKSKNILLNIIKLLIFVLLLSGVFVSTQNALKLKMGHRGTDNVKGFYTLPRESVDVLFLGASTMFCTVDPIVLYRDYGIRAYDFGSSAQPVDLTLIFLEEALKSQKPQVVGIELVSLYKELDTNKAENLNYGLTDLPFSMTKLKGLARIFRQDPGTGLSYLIPMAQYKDRWQELTIEDLQPWQDGHSLGAYTPDTVSEDPIDFSDYSLEAEPATVPERNRQLLKRMVDICHSQGIEVFVFKSANVGWTLGETLGAKSLAGEYGLDYIDYFQLAEELGIDSSRDYRDNTHYNIYGSEKTSGYMGAYLMGRYTLQDRRGEADSLPWQQALELSGR